MRLDGCLKIGFILNIHTVANKLKIKFRILSVILDGRHDNIYVSYQSYLYKEQGMNKTNINLKPYQIPHVNVLNYIYVILR